MHYVGYNSKLTISRVRDAFRPTILPIEKSATELCAWLCLRKSNPGWEIVVRVLCFKPQGPGFKSMRANAVVRMYNVLVHYSCLQAIPNRLVHIGEKLKTIFPMQAVSLL